MYLSPARSKIHYDPLGVVLIIGSWNYPLQANLQPLVATIMAGNCAIVKPSELGHHSAQVIDRLVKEYLD